MQTNADPPIGQIIRSARKQLKISQYELADRLAAISGKATMGRDRVARWERGRQVPRDEWRQWLSVALQVPKSTLDAGAAAARRRSQLGHAAVTANPPVNSNTSRRNQGSPALLPVFRSRVQAGILAATLMNPNRAFSLTELADHAGGSLASVSKESDLLEAAGILARRNVGTVRLVRAVTDRPIVGPLTDLIRVTYGVPQVLSEELGRVPGITRITVCSTWAERFAGLPGIDPTTVQIRLTVPDETVLDEPELEATIERTSKRIRRAIKYTLVGTEDSQAEVNGATIPRQRDRRPVVDVAVLRKPAGHPSIVAPWEQGQDVLGELLDDGQLELVSGTDADATPFFEVAESHLDASDQLMTTSPASAFLMVCQAAQLIGSGMLARQGLRPTPNSASNVVSRAVTAQFGLRFSQLELLRQRALELATPTSRDNRATAADVADYAPTVRSLLDAARTLVPRMGVYA